MWNISIHTPARGVTDMDTEYKKLKAISIHTPARGVTKSGFETYYADDISIHTPARGVTGNQGMNAVIIQFQSTLPQGE